MIRAIVTAFFCAAPLGAAVVEESVAHAGVRFRVVRAKPEQVQVVWKNPQGVPFRTFDAVQAAFAAQGKSIQFLMNAGIYEPGGIPSGLHVEKGKELHAINLATAPGNFFLKPNGVLWLESGNGGKARIAPSEEFAALKKPTPEYAVQSGPLLLIHSKRHPAFSQNSQSKLHRNGVGVDANGRLVFAITERDQLVNLWDFAGLFLQLGCQDALFLDGDISQISVNPDKPISSNQFAAIFVISD